MVVVVQDKLRFENQYHQSIVQAQPIANQTLNQTENPFQSIVSTLART